MEKQTRKRWRKVQYFTLIEVIIAIVIIVMALIAFNAALGTSKRNIVVSKVKLTAQSLAHEYVKRLSASSYQELNLMPESSSGTLLPAEFVDLSQFSGDQINYDLSPNFTGNYTITIQTVEEEVNGVPMNVAKKITATIDVAIESSGLSDITISEQSSIYVFNL